MNIVFMGSPEYAVKILDSLNKHFNILAVYTQPDKPVGRKKILTPTPVKEYAIKNNLNIYTPISLKEDNIIKNLDVNFIVVAAYGLLLPKNILEIAPCINLHASILPKYRGASPIQSAILNGDEYTGVTSMLMNEKLDEGDILVWDYVRIDNKDSLMLFDELADIASKQIIYTLKNFSKIKPLKQNDLETTYCKKIKKEDGFVDFRDSVIMDRKYRAFKGWPGIFCEKFKIQEMKLIDSDSNNKKGKILEVDKEGVVVGCQKGKVKLIKIQVPGKKTIDAISYLNGQRLKVGDSIL